MTLEKLCQLLVLWIATLFVATSALGAEAPASADEDPAFPKPAANADRYILGPGDVIQVFVWRNPELTTTMPVLPDGTISTPLVDGIAASGKTPVQLARDVEAALSEYVKTPRVSVLVSTPKSSFSQVKVVGQVANPQSVPYQDGMAVMDAVLAAGGLTNYARNHATIQRKVDGKEIELTLKVKDLMGKGDKKQNLPLQPGDILVVSETRW